MAAIEVTDLRKTFTATKKEPGVVGALKALFTRAVTTVEAVKGVTFTIDEGEMVGFLGPNGAGKTTTLKMLAGILVPTSGWARVLGATPWERKHSYLRQVSLVMGQKNQLWWDLPAIDSFLLLKEIYDVPDDVYKSRVDELSTLLDVTALLNTQVRKLSLGERMKCELIGALLYNPRVVFLDEPTIGLDVVSQQRIREFLKRYQKQTGSTIVLTSHYMQDIQALCERVVIIDHGSVIFDDSLSLLVERYSDIKRLSLQFDHPVGESEMAAYGRVIECENGRVVLEVERKAVTGVAATILASMPVADIAIEEVEAEEIIRQIFTAGAATRH